MTTEENVSIEIAIQQAPSVALLDPKKKEELYAFLEREIEAFVPDLSTETSRKQIASLAFKVSRTKTAIDDAGAVLKSEWLKKSQAIDLSRREIRERLDALRDKARKPLTDWEKAEEERAAFCANLIGMLEASPRLLATDTSETVAALLAEVEAVAIDPGVFRDDYAAATRAKVSAILSLLDSIQSIQQKESDTLELKRLREETEARALADREAARIAAALQAKKESDDRRLAEEARQIEVAKQAKERHAAELEEAKVRATKEAEERVKREQEAAAKKEADRIEAEHRAALAEERKARAEAEETARQSREKQEAENRARVAAENEAIRKAEADRKLAANKKHRQAIMTTAKEELMEHASLDEETARKVILAISTGKISAVGIIWA